MYVETLKHIDVSRALKLFWKSRTRIRLADIYRREQLFRHPLSKRITRHGVFKRRFLMCYSVPAKSKTFNPNPSTPTQTQSPAGRTKTEPYYNAKTSGHRCRECDRVDHQHSNPKWFPKLSRKRGRRRRPKPRQRSW